MNKDTTRLSQPTSRNKIINSSKITQKQKEHHDLLIKTPQSSLKSENLGSKLHRP